MGFLPKNVMTSNKCLKYNHPTKPQKAYMWERFDWKPLFLGKLRPERSTSNQMVSQQRTSFAWRHKQPIYFFRPQWAGAKKKTIEWHMGSRKDFVCLFDLLFHVQVNSYGHLGTLFPFLRVLHNIECHGI